MTDSDKDNIEGDYWKTTLKPFTLEYTQQLYCFVVIWKIDVY